MMEIKRVVIAISAETEWRAVRDFFARDEVACSPFGEWFQLQQDGRELVFLEGGWGKISAAASTQYAISHWSPDLVVNLGTCGGLAGQIERHEVVLVDRTVVYDIIEQIGDPLVAQNYYRVNLDMSWLPQPYPQPVRRGLLVSADRDICPADIPMLREQFGAVAADWESGAIAWVCSHNQVPCLILRAVSDLVDTSGGEAYQNAQMWRESTHQVMHNMLLALPAWLKSIAG
jgi:adenosylhomocysteine nucleosidase